MSKRGIIRLIIRSKKALTSGGWFTFKTLTINNAFIGTVPFPHRTPLYPSVPLKPTSPLFNPPPIASYNPSTPLELHIQSSQLICPCNVTRPPVSSLNPNPKSYIHQQGYRLKSSACIVMPFTNDIS